MHDELAEVAAPEIWAWLRRCRARTVDAELGQQMLIKQIQNVVEFRERLVGVSANSKLTEAARGRVVVGSAGDQPTPS